MQMMIYLNGRLLRSEEGVISPFDRGFLFGDGLFETMRVYDGRPHLQGRHLRRLRDSAALLGLPIPPLEELAAAIAATIAANPPGAAALRLTITGGASDGGFDRSPDARPTVLITMRPLLQNRSIPTSLETPSWLRTETSPSSRTGTLLSSRTEGEGSTESPASGKNDPPQRALPLAWNEEIDSDAGGERLIALRARHEMPEIGVRVKSLSYLTAIHSAPALAAAGVREGILRTAEGIVAEGTVSNLFAVRRGALYTPPLSLGVLEGITRGRVLELARAAGIECREEEFDLDFMKRADECFYTNSVREVVPVVRIDDDAIARGVPGEITIALLDAYRREAPLEEDLMNGH